MFNNDILVLFQESESAGEDSVSSEGERKVSEEAPQAPAEGENPLILREPLYMATDEILEIKKKSLN